MSIEQAGQGVQTGDRNGDLYEMHNLARAEESLINRLDTGHKGFVTPEQLREAASNKSLSESDRRTAEIMIRTQDDLRYQRLGYLPESPLQAHGPDLQEATGRPFPKGGNPATDKLPIYLADVKKFDASLDHEAVVRKNMEPINYNLSADIFRKYAKEEHGKRLTPQDVWTAVDELSHKKNLTFVEKEELDTLKFTQNQMRQMWPKEPEDHSSPEYKAYIAQTNNLAIDRRSLAINAEFVSGKEIHNPTIGDTYGALHPGRGGATAGDAPTAGPAPADDRPAAPSAGSPAPGGEMPAPPMDKGKPSPAASPPTRSMGEGLPHHSG